MARNLSKTDILSTLEEQSENECSPIRDRDEKRPSSRKTAIVVDNKGKYHRCENANLFLHPTDQVRHKTAMANLIGGPAQVTVVAVNGTYLFKTKFLKGVFVLKIYRVHKITTESHNWLMSFDFDEICWSNQQAIEQNLKKIHIEIHFFKL